MKRLMPERGPSPHADTTSNPPIAHRNAWPNATGRIAVGDRETLDPETVKADQRSVGQLLLPPWADELETEKGRL